MKQLGKLKYLVLEHGYAQVAVWMNYRDTGAIKKWLSRGEIPVIAEKKVKKIIKEKLK